MIQVIINLDDNGNVQVNAPMDRKLEVLGLLEVAKRLVYDFKQEELPKIIDAKGIRIPEGFRLAK